MAKKQKQKKLSSEPKGQSSGGVPEKTSTELVDPPQFPPRMFSKHDHPKPKKSITQYSTRRDLLDSLRTALHEDEWEELRNSHLGVLVKFYELKFGWASRMVHFMLCSQLMCNKPYELWTLIGDQPMRFSLHEFHHITRLNCGMRELVDKPSVEISDDIKEFWELLDISVETGPSYADLLEATRRCSDWEREDRIKLGYLALYASFIEAQPKLDPTKASLAMTVIDPVESPNYPWGTLAHSILMKSLKKADVAFGSYTIHGFVQVFHVWILYALPVYAKKFGEPFIEKPTPPLLAYRGSRGRKYVRRNMLKQTSVKHFIRKDYLDMFPIWANDEEDELITNIVKAMFGQFGSNWRWNETHWPARGVLVNKTDGTASDADTEDDERETKTRKKVGRGKAKVGLSGDLVALLDKGLNNVMEVVKEGIIDMGIKVDMLDYKVDGLASDLAVVKKQVCGGIVETEDDNDEDDETDEKLKKRKQGTQNNVDQSKLKKQKLEDEKQKNAEVEDLKKAEMERQKAEEDKRVALERQEAEEDKKKVEAEKKKAEKAEKAEKKKLEAEKKKVEAENQKLEADNKKRAPRKPTGKRGGNKQEEADEAGDKVDADQVVGDASDNEGVSAKTHLSTQLNTSKAKKDKTVAKPVVQLKRSERLKHKKDDVKN